MDDVTEQPAVGVVCGEFARSNVKKIKTRVGGYPNAFLVVDAKIDHPIMTQGRGVEVVAFVIGVNAVGGVIDRKSLIRADEDFAFVFGERNAPDACNRGSVGTLVDIAEDAFFGVFEEVETIAVGEHPNTVFAVAEQRHCVVAVECVGVATVGAVFVHGLQVGMYARKAAIVAAIITIPVLVKHCCMYRRHRYLAALGFLGLKHCQRRGFALAPENDAATVCAYRDGVAVGGKGRYKPLFGYNSRRGAVHIVESFLGMQRHVRQSLPRAKPYKTLLVFADVGCGRRIDVEGRARGRRKDFLQVARTFCAFEKPLAHRTNPICSTAVAEYASDVLRGQDFDVVGVKIAKNPFLFVIDNQSVVAAKKVIAVAIVEKTVTALGGILVAEVAARNFAESLAVDVNLINSVFLLRQHPKTIGSVLVAVAYFVVAEKNIEHRPERA